MMRKFLVSFLLLLLVSIPCFADQQTRLPNGQGAQSAWSPYPGSGESKWEDVDDPIGTPDDDSTYIYKQDSVGSESVEYTDFDISSSSITSIQVFTRNKRTATGACDIRPFIRVNGVEYYATAQALGTAYSEYTPTWTQNPASGLDWTEAEVEGGGSYPLQQFGVRTINIDAGEEARTTQTYIIVNYTAAAAGGPPGGILLRGVGP